MISERFPWATSVESTMIVLTKSPTSAVSPPVAWISMPCSRMLWQNISDPSIKEEITSPGIRFLFLPMVLDNKNGPVNPAHSKSSVFITMAS